MVTVPIKFGLSFPIIFHTLSGFRHLVWFGVSNLIAITALARLSADGFTSLWCFYAALASGAIALFLRFGQPDLPGDEPAVGASSTRPALP